MGQQESKGVLVEVSCADSDASELDRATRQLRDEIESIRGVEVIEPTMRPPRGTKAGEAALIGQLLLAAVGSGGLAVALVPVLKDWLLRHRGFKLRVKRGQDELEISHITASEFDQLISKLNAWMSAGTDKQ